MSSVSLSTIARQAGVSPSTVSRVLSNHKGISDPTRKRVLTAAESSGYRPNAKLQRFFRAVHARTPTFCLLSAAAFHEEAAHGTAPYVRRMNAFQREARNLHGHLLVADADKDIQPDGIPRCVAEGLVDGVIAQVISRKTIEATARLVPLVLFNQEARLPKIDVVLPDIDRSAAAQLDLLRERGHRQIACFRVRPGLWQDERFWRAYERWHRENDLPLQPEFLAPIAFGLHEESQAIQAFLDRVLSLPEPPSAILTYDSYATELASQLARRGLQVPRDVSLIGFDDWQISLPGGIGLTSFRQDFERMAHMAVTLLMERIDRPDLPARLVECEGALVNRDSVENI